MKKSLPAISLQWLFAFFGEVFQMKYLPIRLKIHPPFLMLLSDSKKFHFLIGNYTQIMTDYFLETFL
jgi:hypothetical protein